MPGYETFTDDLLLKSWQTLKESFESYKRSLQNVESELLARMLERKATRIASGTLDCRIERGKATVDLGVMEGLKELLHPDTITKGFIPEHDETIHIPAKWDLRTVNSWRSHGEDVAAILDKAIIQGTPYIKVREL